MADIWEQEASKFKKQDNPVSAPGANKDEDWKLWGAKGESQESGNHGLSEFVTSPHGYIREGLGRAGRGVMDAINMPGFDSKMKGVSEVGRGLATAAIPAAIPFMVASPFTSAARLAMGTGAQYAFEEGSKAIGIPEGTSQVIGDVAGLGIGSKIPLPKTNFRLSDLGKVKAPTASTLGHAGAAAVMPFGSYHKTMAAKGIGEMFSPVKEAMQNRRIFGMEPGRGAIDPESNYKVDPIKDYPPVNHIEIPEESYVRSPEVNSQQYPEGWSPVKHPDYGPKAPKVEPVEREVKMDQSPLSNKNLFVAPLETEYKGAKLIPDPIDYSKTERPVSHPDAPEETAAELEARVNASREYPLERAETLPVEPLERAGNQVPAKPTAPQTAPIENVSEEVKKSTEGTRQLASDIKERLTNEETIKSPFEESADPHMNDPLLAKISEEQGKHGMTTFINKYLEVADEIKKFNETSKSKITPEMIRTDPAVNVHINSIINEMKHPTRVNKKSGLPEKRFSKGVSDRYPREAKEFLAKLLEEKL